MTRSTPASLWKGGVRPVAGRKSLGVSVAGGLPPCPPRRPPGRPVLQSMVVVVESAPDGYCQAKATYSPPPVYVNASPPEKGTRNSPKTSGSVVAALCTTVMPLMAVVQVVLFVFVVSVVFWR